MSEKDTILPCPGTTFLDLADEWLLNKSYQIKPSTLCKYQQIVDKYLSAYFQSIPLSGLNTILVEKKMRQIYEENCDSISFSTIRSIFYVIKAIIGYGIRSEYMPHIYITFSISNDKDASEIQTLNEYQECRLLNILKENLTNPNHLGIFLSLYTGIRLGEVCALCVNNIDLENNIITISKTVQRINSSHTNSTTLAVTSPKSRRSKRIIPITNFLSDILNDYGISKLPQNAYLLSKKEIPYEPRTLQYAFQRVMNKCGYEGYHFHCLRHTFATKCVYLGFDIKTLSDLLGHSDVSFTMNRYVHSDISEKRKQMNKLEKNWRNLRF